MEPTTKEGELQQRLIRGLAKLRSQIDPIKNPGGYPFAMVLDEILCAVIAGEFPDDGQSDVLSIEHAFNPDRFSPF